MKQRREMEEMNEQNARTDKKNGMSERRGNCKLENGKKKRQKVVNDGRNKRKISLIPYKLSHKVSKIKNSGPKRVLT